MSDKTYRRTFLSSMLVITAFILGACSPKNAVQETTEVKLESSPTSIKPTPDLPEIPAATVETNQTPEPTPTVEPTQIVTQELVYTGENVISAIDGMEMIYIPAGVFTMGQAAEEMMALCLQEMDRESCDWYHVPDEDPVHLVNLNGFWIDKTEVTYTMYVKCMTAGVCTSPYKYDSSPTEDLYNDPTHSFWFNLYS